MRFAPQLGKLLLRRLLCRFPDLAMLLFGLAQRRPSPSFERGRLGRFLQCATRASSATLRSRAISSSKASVS